VLLSTYAELLRLYRAEQTVRERYGSREKLVTDIVESRKRADLTADDRYVEKLTTFSKARLLGLTRTRPKDARIRIDTWRPERTIEPSASAGET
jgi:hypothetical protein